MSGRFRRNLILFAVPGILLLLLVTGSSAQSAYTVTLSSLDPSSFPHLAAYLDVHNPGGEFTHGLSPGEVTIQENGIQVPVNSLVEKKPGVQFAMAISPGATFTIRDSAGISRYEYLLQALLSGAWSSQLPNQDDFSLLAAGGPQLTHVPDPSSIRSALESYRPSDNEAAPNLEVLSAALQLVSDPTPRPGMERAILFITSPQPVEVALGLQSIVSSASQQNIHIFVWLVAPVESFNLPEIDLLHNLASQTRGTFFAFSHDEPVPDLESLLEPLRYVYQLDYDSHIASAGTWQVVAQLSLAGEQITSLPATFEVDLQPPDVVILDPPVEIERNFASQATVDTTNAFGNMQPQEQRLAIKVTFPDGYTHDLTRTSLYVDGVVVAENISPPFEQFEWDLRPYIQEGTHNLKVEATDNLGLVGQSTEIYVKIIVPSTAQEVVAVISRKPLVLAGLAVFTAAAIFLLALIIAGRIRPKLYPGQVKRSTIPGIKAPLLNSRRNKLPRGGRQASLAKENLITRGEPLPVYKRWLALLPWFQCKEEPRSVLAYLDPLVGSDEPTLPAALQLTCEAVALGRDPQKADLIITDPSVEGLHATIRQQGKSFWIIDAGSVAGTWVIYTPVPASGTELKHADIVHLGQVGFRFDLSEPGDLPIITVSPLEPGL
jgi:hypothetical protein